MALGFVESATKCASPAVGLPSTPQSTSDIPASGYVATTPTAFTTPSWMVCLFFLFYSADSNPLKENPVLQMESFFPLGRHQPPHPRNHLMIGLLFHRALDSNLLRSCTQRRPSQMTTLTDSLASGAPPLFPTTIPRQFLTIMNSTLRLTRSNLEISPGSHIPFGTTASFQKMRLPLSG